MSDPRDYDLELEAVDGIPGKADLGDGITIECFDDPTLHLVLTQGAQRIVFEGPGAVVNLSLWLKEFRDALLTHAKKIKTAKPS